MTTDNNMQNQQSTQGYPQNDVPMSKQNQVHNHSPRQAYEQNGMPYASSIPVTGDLPGQANAMPNMIGGKPPVKSGKGSSKKAILIVLGIVVIAIAIWLLVWLFACNGNSVFDPSAQSGQAPYKSQEEIQAELDRTVEEGMFNISIASVIQFDEGTTPGTAYIENVPGNRYLMQVTITDDDTGDVLYESGVLKPNQYIEEITLAKDLDPGQYDATATFKALDQTTYEEIGTAAAKVSINVLG